MHRKVYIKCPIAAHILADILPGVKLGTSIFDGLYQQSKRHFDVLRAPELGAHLVTVIELEVNAVVSRHHFEHWHTVHPHQAGNLVYYNAFPVRVNLSQGYAPSNIISVLLLR